MEIKKIIIILLIAYVYPNEFLEYQVTLYGIPMAKVNMEFKDTVYTDTEAMTLYFKTSTNNIISQFFKVDNKYQTIIEKNNLDIMSFKKITYQPNVSNEIATITKNKDILYQGTNILIPKQHFNIFSLLYYLSVTSFDEIKSEVNLEREGLIYKCIIKKKKKDALYEFELEFELVKDSHGISVFENTDIFTWGLFRTGAKNKIIINPSLNQITQCTFSVGFSKLEAKIKRPLSK